MKFIPCQLVLNHYCLFFRVAEHIACENGQTKSIQTEPVAKTDANIQTELSFDELAQYSDLELKDKINFRETYLWIAF